MAAFVREFIADEIVSPRPRGDVVRYRPGRILVSDAGRILSIEKASKSHSKRARRSRCIIPGLIDSHTHTLFAGNRADEWGRRLAGESYQSIAKKGGGIQKTVRETRAATSAQLTSLAKERLQKFLELGVTTVEIKSGYGLDLPTELKILQVVKDLQKANAQELVPTFMGAHALPAGFSKTSDYIEYLIEDILPELKGLAEFQDVFVETGYFKKSESIALLRAGKKFGLKPKVHAHEFARSGGVEVAAAVGAVSADHLMVLNSQDISLLKKFGVIAVILPATSFFLGAKKFSPARKLIDAGVKVAIASDFNPGTNPSLNLPLAGTFAAIHQGLNLEEILTAQTWHAALALDRRDRGCLQTGFRADFVEIDADRFEEIYYSYGSSRVSSVFVGGRKIL